jgi:hypothetical protein
VSRLTEAHRAVERLRAHGLPSQRGALDAITLALGRMAQLEKVAELARRLVDPMGQGPRADRAALLDLALIELDHHPDTKEP